MPLESPADALPILSLSVDLEDFLKAMNYYPLESRPLPKVVSMLFMDTSWYLLMNPSTLEGLSANPDEFDIF